MGKLSYTGSDYPTHLLIENIFFLFLNFFMYRTRLELRSYFYSYETDFHLWNQRIAKKSTSASLLFKLLLISNSLKNACMLKRLNSNELL